MKEKNLKEVFDDLEKDPEIARQFEYFGALTRLVLEVVGNDSLGRGCQRVKVRCAGLGTLVMRRKAFE